MDSLFGGGVAGKTREESGPSAGDPFSQLRLSLIQQMLSGDLSPVMAGYQNKVLIPTTMNELTRTGLGRSGAVGEAVSNAVLGQGLQFIESLMSGVPSSRTTTTEKQPGAVDWLGAFGPIIGALFGRGGVLGGSTT